jgi:hypothetical protein
MDVMITLQPMNIVRRRGSQADHSYDLTSPF